MKTRALLFPGLAGMLLALAACGDKQPGEDAVATVNGYEITNAELNNEMAASGVTETADENARRAALQAIINRKLLSDMAAENDLDKTPEFILNQQRMREALLAEAAIRSLAPEGSRARREDVDNYVKNNLAGGRTIYAIQGLQFPTPSKPGVMDKLGAAHSFEEVQAVLRDNGIEAQSGQMTWDSAAMPSELVQRINALPDGEPFIIPQANGMVAGVIREKRNVPLDANQSRDLAENAVAQQTVRTRVSDWLEQARHNATINYSDGYAPEGTPGQGAPESNAPPAAAAAAS